MNITGITSNRPSRAGRVVGHDPQKLGEWLLTAYLGTAPVYWLPGFPMGSMQLIKLALIAGACGVIWYEAVQRDHRLFPPGLVGLTGFYLVLLTSFTGMIRAVSMGEAISVVENLGQSFLFLWTLYIFYTSGGNVVRVFRNAAAMIVLLSIPPITNWFTGIPGWSYSGEDPLWSTGFTTKRTGWSQGVALYLPIVAVFPLFRLKNKAISYGLSLAGVAILLVGQFITGGRGGLLASFVVLALLYILLMPRKVSIVLFLALVSAGYYFSNFAYDHLRFYRFTKWSYESLNLVSAGRLEQYFAGYDLFWQKPFGHGFGRSLEILIQQYQKDNEIHNVWLRILADGGILLLISILSVVIHLFRNSLGCLRLRVLRRIRAGLPVQNSEGRRQLILVVCFAIFLAGLSISMFAPRTPIGVFQNSAMWWGSAGTIVGIRYLNTATRAKLQHKSA